jgi:hypothetical protein
MPHYPPGFGPTAREQIEILSAEIKALKSARAEELVHIAALRAEVEKLRSALKPFAEYGVASSTLPDDFPISPGSTMARRQLTIGDCRRAKAALAAPVDQERKAWASVREGAAMAKRRLDDFADKANAGQVHYSARELKRKIGAAFADFDKAALAVRDEQEAPAVKP